MFFTKHAEQASLPDRIPQDSIIWYFRFHPSNHFRPMYVRITKTHTSRMYNSQVIIQPFSIPFHPNQTSHEKTVNRQSKCTRSPMYDYYKHCNHQTAKIKYKNNYWRAESDQQSQISRFSLSCGSQSPRQCDLRGKSGIAPDSTPRPLDAPTIHYPVSLEEVAIKSQYADANVYYKQPVARHVHCIPCREKKAWGNFWCIKTNQIKRRRSKDVKWRGVDEVVYMVKTAAYEWAQLAAALITDIR